MPIAPVEIEPGINGNSVSGSPEFGQLHAVLAEIHSRSDDPTKAVGSLATEQQAKIAETESSLPLAKESLTTDQVVRSFEENNVVKQAPNFVEQASDKSRTRTYAYTPFTTKKSLGSTKRGMPTVEGVETEADGLSELHDLLEDFLKKRGSRAAENHGRKDKVDNLFVQAESMMENLSFIGAPELDEASRGLGSYWKAYLEENPDRKIVVLTEMGMLERHEKSLKSDEFIRDNIISTFSTEELEKYGSRILFDADDLDENDQPEDIKAIIVDDWSISGGSARDVYKKLYNTDEKFRLLADEGSVEFNFLIANGERVTNGLLIDPGNEDSPAVPVKAYYLAHNAPDVEYDHNSHIAGLHGTVNFGFEEILTKITRKSGIWRRRTPKLARIASEYKIQNKEKPRKPRSLRELAEVVAGGLIVERNVEV